METTTFIKAARPRYAVTVARDKSGTLNDVASVDAGQQPRLAICHLHAAPRYQRLRTTGYGTIDLRALDHDYDSDGLQWGFQLAAQFRSISNPLGTTFKAQDFHQSNPDAIEARRQMAAIPG